MNADTPIQMPNRKLAEAMITAGCEFAPQEYGGPCLNFYTPNMLRARRIIGANAISAAEFERKVIETAEFGRSGEVTYFFKRNSEAENFVKAWDAMSDLVRAHAEYEAMSPADKAATDAPNPLPDIPIEIIAQVLCIHANNEGKFKRFPFVNAPICNTLAGKYVAPREGTKECSTGIPAGNTSGAGKVWSTDLPNEAEGEKGDRKKMGLHKQISKWNGAIHGKF